MKPQGGTVARNLEELKRTLGFPGPWSSRLDEALTHRSYAVENNLAYDNQRLEFLGDAVLEIILTEYLFNLYPDAPEGEMTKMRSALVREAAVPTGIPHWPTCSKRCWERSTWTPDSMWCATSYSDWPERSSPTRVRC